MLDYGIIFFTGLLTSLHCVGMCGAIVLAYSMPAPGAAEAARPPLLLHAAYNGGRILSYALIGALLGALGMTLSAIERAGEIVAIVSGVIMIGGALAMFGVLSLPSTVSFGLGGVSRAHGSLIRGKTLASKFSLGALTPFLPCGLLYAMLARSAATGSAVHGAATMAVFGAGMAPALVLLGGFSSFFSARIRRGAELAAAAAILVMGVTLVLRGFHVPFAAFLPVGGPMAGEKHSCCPQ